MDVYHLYKKSTATAGFTLLELLITTAVAIILILGILRVYLSSVNNYNAQEVITEMNQNAAYTCRRISESIMQSGTCLPDSDYPVIAIVDGRSDSLCIRANPAGAMHTFFVATDSTTEIEVPDARGFRGVTEVVKESSTGAVSTFQINTDFNAPPFVTGVNTDSTPHVIKLRTKAAFRPGDRIFASDEQVFFTCNTDFCLGSSTGVLAENIDSLSIQFFDKSNTVTTDWFAMRYAKVFVRSRASVPDVHYTHPACGDHYRRTIQTMDILIRRKATF